MFKQLGAFLNENELHENFSLASEGDTVQRQHLFEQQMTSEWVQMIQMSPSLFSWAYTISAAFHAVDQKIKLNPVENCFSLSGTALKSFHTYLNDRKYFVSHGDHISEMQSIHFGIPQSSILGLLLFWIHKLPVAKIFFCDHGVNFHCYTDDIQVYISIYLCFYWLVLFVKHFELCFTLWKVLYK